VLSGVSALRGVRDVHLLPDRVQVLLDVLAGFTVSLMGARKDVDFST
jgi:hypothetical protein